MKNKRRFDLSVYFVADPSVCKGRAVEHVVASAVRGGVSMVQLRNKLDPVEVVEGQARAIQDVLQGTEVAFIINDHVQLAAKIGADGVHIGQEDMSTKDARNIIGEDRILGLTAFTPSHYDALDPQLVDYVGAGPFYATLTKPDKPVLGEEGFPKLIRKSPVPVVGIGGITAENADAVIRAGADGVAMMRALSEAEDVESAAREFVKVVKEAKYVYSQCA